MSILNSSEGTEAQENPAVARLEIIIGKLQSCLKQSAGENAEWENSVSNKITVLQIAAQTVLNHEDLPEGMTLRELEKSAEELISQRPQNA